MNRLGRRWIFPVGLAGLWLAAVAWSRLAAGATGQQRNGVLLASTAVALLLLVLWFALFSGLPRRVRLGGAALVVAAVGLAAALLEIRGVTGDFVPIVAFRWASGEAVPPAAAAGGTAGSEAVPAASYPGFLGQRRDATVAGVHLARDWGTQPPREVWRRPVGPGWSSFAVVNGIAVTQEQRGPQEAVVAYRLADGSLLWEHSDEARYDTVIAGVGPRATPTVADGRVYTLGATGLLNALDLTTGRRLWWRDIVRDAGAGQPEWGRSCSPLVLDGLVVVSAGGPEGRSLLAYHRDTGELAWAGGDDDAGYSSPFAARLAGRKQVVIFNRSSVAAHDPGDGHLLWSFDWPSGQPNVSQPVVLPGDRLFVSSGYGIGAKLLRITGDGDGGLRPQLLWESRRLKAKFANVVFHEGYLYGLDDGVLVCLDPATGERCWKRGRYGHGQLLLVDDLLLVQAESGEVVLVDPDPSGLRELGRFEALSEKTWNHPVLVGPYLLVRNHREAACFELPLAP